jgi:COP9 signalosome complex subunit 8
VVLRLSSSAMATLEALTTLAAGDDIEALLTCCEEFELDLGHSAVAPQASLDVYKIHMVAYLLCEQLENARFLWKRLKGTEASQDAELGALWSIGKAMWGREPAQTQAAMVAHQWSQPVIARLVARMQHEHLQRSFDGLARAYSLISASALAAILGISVDKVHEMANAAGWTVDAESGAYAPSVAEAPKGKPELMQQLSILTDYVAHMEKEVK